MATKKFYAISKDEDEEYLYINGIPFKKNVGSTGGIPFNPIQQPSEIAQGPTIQQTTPEEPAKVIETPSFVPERTEEKVRENIPMSVAPKQTTQSPFSPIQERFSTVDNRPKQAEPLWNGAQQLVNGFTRAYENAKVSTIKTIEGFGEQLRKAIDEPNPPETGKYLKETLFDMKTSADTAVKDFFAYQVPRAALTWLQAGAENVPISPIGSGLDKKTREWTSSKLGTWISALEDKQRQDMINLGLSADSSPFDPKNFAYNLTSGGMSMTTALGVSLATGNPTFGATLLGMIEGSDTYTEAKRAGKSDKEALALASVNSIGIAALERLSIEYMFKNVGGGKFFSAASKGVVETFQEGTQTVYSNLVEKVGYDRSRKITENLLETVVYTLPIGMLSGAGIDLMPTSKVLNGNLQEADLAIMDELQIAPETGSRAINDIAKKVNMELTGDLNTETELGKKIMALKDTRFDSPGHFWRLVAGVMKSDESFKPSLLQRLGDTVGDFYQDIKIDDALLAEMKRRHLATDVYAPAPQEVVDKVISMTGLSQNEARGYINSLVTAMGDKLNDFEKDVKKAEDSALSITGKENPKVAIPTDSAELRKAVDNLGILIEESSAEDQPILQEQQAILSETLQEFNDLNDETAARVNNANGTPLAHISTVTYDDGKVALQVQANTGVDSITVPFDTKNLYASKSAAVEAGTGILQDFINGLIQDARRPDLAQLQRINSMIQGLKIKPEKGGQKPILISIARFDGTGSDIKKIGFAPAKDIVTLEKRITKGERPPVTVVRSGGRLVVSKGADALTAYQKLGIRTVPIIDQTGGRIFLPAKQRVAEAIAERKAVEKKARDERKQQEEFASEVGEKKTTQRLIRERKLETNEEMPRNFKLSEEAKRILIDLNIPIAEKELSKRHLGIYKPLSKKVRVQSMYDVTTVVHEATHAIDDRFGITKEILEEKRNNAIRKSLTDIYEKLYPTGKRTHPARKRMVEGLATFIENYFYHPDGMKKQYPVLVDAFIKPEGAYYNATIQKLLTRMNALVDQYARMTPVQRIGSRIMTKKEMTKQNKGFPLKERLLTTVADIFRVGRYYTPKELKETWSDPTIHGFNMLNKNTHVWQWIFGKTKPILRADGSFMFEGGTVSEYMKMVKGKELEFSSYLIARRVVEGHNKLVALKKLFADAGGDEALEKTKAPALIETKEKIINLEKIIENDDLSLQDATATVEEFADVFAKPEKIYDNINRTLITVAEEMGLLSKERADEYWAERGYASFKRYIDDEIEASLGTLSGSSKSKISAFRGRKGSQLQIIDPTYSQVLAINETLTKGYENLLWTKFYELSKNDPNLAQRFELITAYAVPDSRTGRLTYPQDQDPGLLRFFVNGERHYIKAAPEFIALMKALRPQEMELWAQLIRIPSSIFTRLTTTANPIWALGTNLTIDQFSKLAQTKTGATPVGSLMSSKHYVADGIRRIGERFFGKDAKIENIDEASLQAYIAAGGRRQTLAAFYDMSPEEAQHITIGGKSKGEKIKHVVDSTIGVLEAPSNMTEIMSRFDEYRRAIAQGKSMSEAMYMASEVTVPFQLHGTFGGKYGVALIKSIPYFNAAIQVLYKYGRTAKDNPVRLATVGAGIITAGIGITLFTLLHGSDEQKRLLGETPARELARGILIPHPDGKRLIRLRIPEQFGTLMALTQLWMIANFDQNKAAFKDYYDAATAWIPDQFNLADPKKAALSWIPQTFKPSIEVATNTKTYPEVMPIVPYYLQQNNAPEDQYTQYTSKVAVLLGELFNASPAMIDFWVSEQFGSVAGTAMNIAGKVGGRSFADELQRKNPMIRQEQDFVMMGRSYNNFYDTKLAIDQQYKKYKDSDEINPQDKFLLKEQHTVYNDISDVLSDARAVVKSGHQIDGTILQPMYEMLKEVDRAENLEQLGRVRALKNNIEVEVNKLKYIYGIK